MVQLFEITDGGINIKLNSRGDLLCIPSDYPVVLEDVMGACVKFLACGGMLTCEADLPESTGSFQWTFDVKNIQRHSHTSSHFPNGANNLEGLILSLRIAMTAQRTSDKRAA